MAFSAYEDALSRKNMAMPTLLATFDDLRRVTHGWLISLASRPAAAHLLVTLSTITASWQSKTKAGLPAEIDASSFNITIDLPPAESKAIYEWSYKNNSVLRQLFDFQRARIMQEVRASEPGLALAQAAAPASRNEGWGTDDAESPRQLQPIDALIVDTNLAAASIGMPTATIEVAAEAGQISCSLCCTGLSFRTEPRASQNVAVAGTKSAAAGEINVRTQ